MKKLTTVITLLVFTMVFTSCKKESLQSYLVESQEKEGFITVDLPISFLKAKEGTSEDVQKTIESIKKINVVALPYKGNEAAYQVEKEKIKTIISESNDYKRLMKMNMKGVQMDLYYSGKSDAIDEIIAFGYSESMGVGVARILGENMNPSNIMEMMQNIDVDTQGVNLKNLNLGF